MHIGPHRLETGLWVRPEGKRIKQRKLRLPPELTTILQTYTREYPPQKHLFACSERNLAYILKDVAQ